MRAQANGSAALRDRGALELLWFRGGHMALHEKGLIAILLILAGCSVRRRPGPGRAPSAAPPPSSEESSSHPSCAACFGDGCCPGGGKACMGGSGRAVADSPSLPPPLIATGENSEGRGGPPPQGHPGSLETFPHKPENGDFERGCISCRSFPLD